MFINYIYNHILTSDSTNQNETDIYIISFPDFYNLSDITKLITSYEYSDIKNKDINFIPQSIAIGLEYGLYKSIKNIFNNETNILFISID